MKSLVLRDERETSVDHAADRLSYLVLSFGLLLVVAIRSAVGREASWDLLALVVLAGVVGTGYRAWRGAVTRRWLLAGLAAAGAALVVAAAIAAAARP